MLYNACGLDDWRHGTVVSGAGVSLKEQVSYIGGGHHRLRTQTQTDTRYRINDLGPTRSPALLAIPYFTVGRIRLLEFAP